MSCADIAKILENHGCIDLTKFIVESACGQYPIANGGLGDVFYGKLRNGASIAIKTIRASCDPGLPTPARVYHKQAAKEIYAWSKCDHPNVARLIGIANFRDCLAMISFWEENGNLLQYLLKNSSTDRCQLSTSICAGLVYLHDNGIVHGDLKGANVLISHGGIPKLMDFGNATLQNATLQFAQTSTTQLNLTLRWTAPEIAGGESLHTMAGDVYSLGMTILETFTSQVPFANITENALLLYVFVHRKKPTRPGKIIPKNSADGDKLWLILTKCWAYDPKGRPDARTIWESMESIRPGNLLEMDDAPGGGAKGKVKRVIEGQAGEGAGNKVRSENEGYEKEGGY